MGYKGSLIREEAYPPVTGPLGAALGCERAQPAHGPRYTALATPMPPRNEQSIGGVYPVHSLHVSPSPRHGG